MSTHTTTGDVINISDDLQQRKKSESLFSTAMRRIRRDYLTLAAIAVLLTLTLLSAAAPTITNSLGVSYTETNPTNKHQPIGSEGHILGTDHLGRDVLARLLYGGRVSIVIGFSVAIFSVVIGVTLGLIAGYYQGGAFGFIDDAIMWFVTTLASIPLLLLLILIGAVFVPTIPVLIGILTFTSWAGTMRLIRGETMSHRGSEYVLSARALGAGPSRIMFVHILPNTLSILLTDLAMLIGTIILVESALSFLGLGVRPPEPSWGNMLTGAQNFIRQAPHMSILPGLLITITVLSLYLIGDGLRDAFDPRSTK